MAALPGALRETLGAQLGAPVTHDEPVYGGDINQAARFEAGGAAYFVKWSADAPRAMFPAEAHGLRLLRAPGTIRVPEVIAQGDANGACPAYLVLEWVEIGGRRGGCETAMEALGEGLARLHRIEADEHGLDRDNFIGRLPQPNAPVARWGEFYRDRRIGAQAEIARKRGRLPARRADLLARLIARLPDLLDDAISPPSLLHGDLWGGNYLVDEGGAPVLIDPAVYYGHREMDLAMTELFGGFSTRFYDAYHAVYPVDPGYGDRRALYQLYYLLVHLNLFGESYGGRVDSIAARYAGRG